MICWHLVYKALNEYYTVLLGHSQQFLKYHNVEWKKKVSMAPTQQSCRLATHASLKSLAAHTQKTKQNKKKNLFDVNVFTKTILHGKLHFYSLDEKN